MSKLSVLVATKVMGWPTIDRDTPYRTISTQAGYVCEGVAERRVAGIQFEAFRPECNTSDAMEVFNHFPAGHIEKETCKIDGALYMVNIGGGYADTYSGNRSLCVAICLAALRAKGMTDAEIGEALK